MKQKRLLFMGSVAVASVLADQPVLTQMLGFLQAAALAVKKGTVQGTVGVVNTRNTVCVLESFAAFLSGHQIVIVPSFISPFNLLLRRQGTQRLLLYHAGETFAIAVLPKDTFCFSMRLWHKKA